MNEKTIILTAKINDNENKHFTRIVVKTNEDRSGFELKVETAYDKGFALADRGLCFEGKNMSEIGMFDFAEMCDRMIGPHKTTPICDAIRKLLAS